MNRTVHTNIRHHRTRIDRIKLWLIGSLMLVLLILSSIYVFSKTVTAQRDVERMKLVTSVEIQKGDTLWSIAKSYISDEYEDIHEYVDELMESNGLVSDTIHAGNYIIVPYYMNSSEVCSTR